MRISKSFPFAIKIRTKFLLKDSLMLLHMLWLDRSYEEGRRWVGCHHCNRSPRCLLMREVKMTIHISRLTATVSMLHECRRLVWMTARWRVYMVGMWSWGAARAVVFRCQFRVLRC